MLTIYNSFHLVTCNDGVLLVSTKKIDDPFVIVLNDNLGFFIIHGGKTNYDIRFQVKDYSNLDLTNMITYHVEIADSSHWALAIPYKGLQIVPESLYAFSSISIQKKFSVADFPASFSSYGSLAVITGFPE
jgi:hypothetical protein